MTGGSLLRRAAISACLLLLFATASAATSATAMAASGPLHFGTPSQIDKAPGSATPAVTGLSCTSPSQCLAVHAAGGGVSFRAPIKVGSGKDLAGLDPDGGFVGVSCPSSALCFGIDTEGHVLSTTTPGAAQPWTVAATFGANEPNLLTSITCPSAHLCVLIDGSFRTVLVSTDPTGPRSSWHTVLDEGNNAGPVEVACPAAQLCVEGSRDLNSSIYHLGIIRHPTKKSDWSDAKGPGAPRGPISCPSSHACVIFGKSGSSPAVSWTTDLGHGWHTARFASGPASPTSLDCPSARLCLAGGRAGQVARLTLPVAAHGTPHLSTATAGSASVTIESIACPSTKLCLAGDSTGHTLIDTHPSTGSGPWQTAHTVTSHAALLAVTCPSATSCVAGDDAGAILTAPGPAGPWARKVIDAGNSITAISCVNATRCFAGDSAGQLLASGAAGLGGPWAVSSIEHKKLITSLACPSAVLCLAGFSPASGGEGGASLSQDPTAATPTWTPVGVDGDLEEEVEDPFVACTAVNACASAFFSVQTDASTEGPLISTTTDPATRAKWKAKEPTGGAKGRLTAISCSPLTCVATSNTGQVDVGSIASTHPFAAATIDTGRPLTGVDCTTMGRCVAIDGAGAVFSSDTPSAGASTWHKVATLSGGGQDAIACPTSRSCVVVDSGGRAAVGTAAD